MAAASVLRQGLVLVAPLPQAAAVATREGMGSAFLPTTELLRDIAQVLGREPNDPVVIAAFDRLVLRGQLVPFVEGWWELIGWRPGELEGVLQRGR